MNYELRNYGLRIMNYELRITELRNHKKEQRNISDPEVNKVIYGIQTQRHQG
jgi:uncharacterized metal-binding protein